MAVVMFFGGGVGSIRFSLPIAQAMAETVNQELNSNPGKQVLSSDLEDLENPDTLNDLDDVDEEDPDTPDMQNLQDDLRDAENIDDVVEEDNPDELSDLDEIDEDALNSSIVSEVTDIEEDIIGSNDLDESDTEENLDDSGSQDILTDLDKADKDEEDELGAPNTLDIQEDVSDPGTLGDRECSNEVDIDVVEDQTDKLETDATVLENAVEETEEDSKTGDSDVILESDTVSDEALPTPDTVIDTDEYVSLLGSSVVLTSMVETEQTMIEIDELADLQSAIISANDGDIIKLSSYFSEDLAGLVVSNGKAFTLDLGGKNLSSADSNGTFTASISVTKGSALTLTGGTIVRGEGHDGNLIRVTNGGQLTLVNVTLDGGGLLGSTGDSLVYVSGSTSVVNITDGALLTNNERNSTNRGDGGAVYVDQGAKLIMDGGEISGNSTSGSGGGLYISNSSEATFAGGTINNNDAGWGGGIDARGTVVIEDAEIKDNTALHFGGGIQASNMLLISGGTISGNKAQSGGGGIFVHQGVTNRETTVIIQGGEIKDNSSNSQGGGIYLSRDSWLGITGGEISGNKAWNGGGIYSNGVISIANGKISKNTANYGGGVYSDSLLTGGIVTITGGEISENAAGDGGGLYAMGGTITIENGTISGNEARNGAGIYAFSSLTGFVGKDWPLPVTLMIKGGAITNNHTTGDYGNGGGIYIMENETVKGSYNISGGEISGNTAWSGGGIFTLYFDQLTISGGSIKENKANNGGGISAFGGTLVVSGGTITDNEAAEEGGGIRIYSNTEASILGGEIKNNIAGKAGDDIASPVHGFTMQDYDGWYWDNEDARAREGAGKALTEIPAGGSVYLAFDPIVTVPPPAPTPSPTATPQPTTPTNATPTAPESTTLPVNPTDPSPSVDQPAPAPTSSSGSSEPTVVKTDYPLDSTKLSDWKMPFAEGTTWKIESDAVDHRNRYAAGYSLDYILVSGDDMSVYAPFSGIVVQTTQSIIENDGVDGGYTKSEAQRYGNFIQLIDPVSGYSVILAHLANDSVLYDQLKPGTRIEQGTKLGTVSNTRSEDGFETISNYDQVSVHLHFEIRENIKDAELILDQDVSIDQYSVDELTIGDTVTGKA